MNSDNAARFAQRMIETWPNGPRRNVWHDIALDLDTETARTAYDTLTRTATHISTAAFHQAYTSSQRRRIEQPAHDCPDCTNGWADTLPRIHPDSSTTTQVRPCQHCNEGKQRAASTIWTKRYPSVTHDDI